MPKCLETVMVSPASSPSLRREFAVFLDTLSAEAMSVAVTRLPRRDENHVLISAGVVMSFIILHNFLVSKVVSTCTVSEMLAMARHRNLSFFSE